MEDENTARHGVSFVACKPVWEYGIWSIISLLHKYGHINICLSHIGKEVSMLTINFPGELFAVFIMVSTHELVV